MCHRLAHFCRALNTILLVPLIRIIIYLFFAVIIIIIIFLFKRSTGVFLDLITLGELSRAGGLGPILASGALSAILFVFNERVHKVNQVLILHIVEVLTTQEYIVEQVVENILIDVFLNRSDRFHDLVEVKNALLDVVFASQGLKQNLPALAEVLID